MHRTVLALAALAFTVLAFGASAPALAQGKAQLDAVSIHLFLATSGALSPDVETIKGFGARNFSVWGEGIADNERFYAALIRVRFTSKGEVFAQGAQALVVVTDRSKKQAVRRERIADVYVGSHGYTHVPVFLPSAACGPLEIVVTGSGRKIVRQLEATCGE
jgi:hypothetical protein